MTDAKLVLLIQVRPSAFATGSSLPFNPTALGGARGAAQLHESLTVTFCFSMEERAAFLKRSNKRNVPMMVLPSAMLSSCFP